MHHARCGDLRRSEYVPAWLPDEFIVPLLKEWIETTIRDKLSNGGRRVLDAGCGRQPFRTLIESLNGQYVSFDVNQSPENSVNFLGVLDGDLPQALLEIGPFDLILCTEVLEHVANWQSAFDNFTRLLGAGGYLVITCPHFYQLHELPYDFWRPTSFAIEWHAERVGFTVERLERLGNAWDVLGGVLANMCPYPKPSSRTVGSRLAGRIARVLIRRILFPILRKRWLHSRLDPKSTLYLANVAVLRKQ
jgi:SAM-dependent methyltransferase